MTGDIAVNWFNWPIIQLKKIIEKIVYSLLHIPYDILPYAIYFLSVSLLVFMQTEFPFCGRVERESSRDLTIYGYFMPKSAFLTTRYFVLARRIVTKFSGILNLMVVNIYANF